MASCALAAAGRTPNGLLASRIVAMPAFGFVPSRGKKNQPSKVKKKKDLQREMIKDLLKKKELQQLVKGAALRAAKSGGPLDPEMLNPARKRAAPTLGEAEKEERFLLVKEWTRYKMARHKEELVLLQGMRESRAKALRELRRVSHSLHDRALDLNPRLFPFERSGPTRTPPIAGYVPPEAAES